MKKTIEVGASFGGKIPTGSYENMNPNFFAKEVFEFEGTEEEIQDLIKRRQDDLHKLCLSNFEAVAIQARIQKIQNDRKDFRWYEKDGEKFISVTSILNYDVDFYVDENELKQYAAQGTVIDARVKHLIKTGEWVDASKIEGITSELFILKTGSLKLSLEAGDFPAFLKKHPLDDMKVGEPIFNLEHRYAGTPDIICKSGGLLTVADVKRNVTTENKIKYLMQTAAYAKGLSGIQQLILIPLNDKTEQGFSKPIITTEVDRYFDLFLAKRNEFRKIYGI